MNAKLPKRAQSPYAATFLALSRYGLMVIGFIIAVALILYGLEILWPTP
jgi:hypothetical protein